MRRTLAFIAAGYLLAVIGGSGAVLLSIWLMPETVSQNSGGMVAFSDMLLFVAVSGLSSLVPSWFALKLAAAEVPRLLTMLILVVGLAGVASWLAVVQAASGNGQSSLPDVAGLLLAFGAIPRIAAGPILLLLEGAAFVLVKDRTRRVLIAAAMLMDIVPLLLFAAHLFRAIRY